MPFDSSELLFSYSVLTAILICDFNKSHYLSTHLASYSCRLCLWWHRYEGAFHVSFCLCTSPLFLLSIRAGSCKDWLPRRIGLSRSGKKTSQQIKTEIKNVVYLHILTVHYLEKQTNQTGLFKVLLPVFHLGCFPLSNNRIWGTGKVLSPWPVLNFSKRALSINWPISHTDITGLLPG